MLVGYVLVGLGKAKGQCQDMASATFIFGHVGGASLPSINQTTRILLPDKALKKFIVSPFS